MPYLFSLCTLYTSQNRMKRAGAYQPDRQATDLRVLFYEENVKGMEQAIGYIVRSLSLIPGVAYAQQLPTPEAKLHSICDAVQNDAMTPASPD